MGVAKRANTQCLCNRQRVNKSGNNLKRCSPDCGKCAEAGETSIHLEISCESCGKKVIPQKSTQRFCSVHCREEAKKLRVNKGRKPKLHLRGIQRAEARAKRLINLQSVRCLSCGGPVKKRGNNIKWCSNKCRDRYKRIQLGDKPIANKLSCQNCGKSFKPRLADQKWCTKQCADRGFQKKLSKSKRRKALNKTALARSQIVSANQEQLTISEAAIVLRISPRSMERLIHEKKITSKKLRRKTIILRSDIREYINHQ